LFVTTYGCLFHQGWCQAIGVCWDKQVKPFDTNHDLVRTLPPGHLGGMLTR